MKKVRSKMRRNTRQKRITSLVRRGKLLEALRAARGWRVDEPSAARRLVEVWQAIAMLEDEPELRRGSPPGFYDDLLRRAERATCGQVRDAIRNGDADFFRRMALVIKKPESVARDPLRVHAIAAEFELFLRGGAHYELLEKRSAKEVAHDVVRESPDRDILGTAEQVRRLRREFGKDK